MPDVVVPLVAPAPGTVINPGTLVTPGGAQGNPGAQGIAGTAGTAGPPGSIGLNAFNTTTAGFTVPAVGASVNVVLNDASWVVAGQFVFVDSAGGPGQAGALQVTSKSGNQVTLLNPAPAPAIPAASSSAAGLMNSLSGNATDYVGGDNACHPLRGPIAIRVFANSGTYTPTAGMRTCLIECVGGGGAGGGNQGQANYWFFGGGGGAGGYSRKLATATQIGASQVVTVGAAGVSVANGNGGAGGNTSVGGLCVANGGSGGAAAGNGATPGPGGSVGTGDVTCTGAPGAGGLYATAAVFGGFGGGGSSTFGGGSPSQFCNGGSWCPGVNANGYGGGGSGGGAMNIATGVISGGYGGSGLVVITEYGL